MGRVCIDKGNFQKEAAKNDIWWNHTGMSMEGVLMTSNVTSHCCYQGVETKMGVSTERWPERWLGVRSARKCRYVMVCVCVCVSTLNHYPLPLPHVIATFLPFLSIICPSPFLPPTISPSPHSYQHSYVTLQTRMKISLKRETRKGKKTLRKMNTRDSETSGKVSMAVVWKVSTNWKQLAAVCDVSIGVHSSLTSCPHQGAEETRSDPGTGDG